MSVNEENKFRRRTSSVSLTLDVDLANTGQQVNAIVSEDVVEEGRELFQNFLKDEIHRSGLNAPPKCFSPYCR